jgi:hypothetical protein
VSGGPALSVILPTDAFSTIEPVIRRLRAQSVVEKLELVIVTPRPAAVEQEAANTDGFGAIVVVEVDGLVPLTAARAAGIRAATAPVVFLGETHTYPEEGWAEALIDAHANDWAAVVPGFGNANPSGVLSWAGFLIDYGPWLSSLEPQELSQIPTYNTAYRRAALLDLGPRLDLLLTSGDELIVNLRAAGGRFVFEPSARINHVNVARPSAWVLERYLSGMLTANSRMERWSWARRLLYVLGSPLIPVVILSRVAGGVAAAHRAYSLPLAVFPALVMGAGVSAVGELVGYLGGPVAWADKRMTEYEINRLRYLGA